MINYYVVRVQQGCIRNARRRIRQIIALPDDYSGFETQSRKERIQYHEDAIARAVRILLELQSGTE